MFWSFILPFFITCAICPVVLLLILVIYRKRSSVKVTLVGIFLILVLFIPCCAGIQFALSPFRFGVFHYDNGIQLQSGQTKGRIPESARNVIIDLQPSGFNACYTINRNDIEKFNDSQWSSWGSQSVIEKIGVKNIDPDEIEIRISHFSKYGWKLNGQVCFLKGPRGSNGKGYDILYSDTDLLAIQSWSYW